MDFFDMVAEDSNDWEIGPSSSLEHRNPIPSGQLELSERDDLSARIAALQHKLDSLELKNKEKLVEVQMVCRACDQVGHDPNSCPELPLLKEVAYGNAYANNLQNRSYQNRGQGSTSYPQGGNLRYQGGNQPPPNVYPQAWKNPPGFGWKNDNQSQQFQPPPLPPPQYQQPNPVAYQPPHKKSFEDTLLQLVQQHSVTIDNLTRGQEDIRGQLAKLTQALSTTQSGKFPAQPFPNPKGQANMTESSTSGATPHEQVQAVTTLRSGKIIHKPSDPRVSVSNNELGSGDSEENEPFDSFQTDSKIPETSFVESLEDMPTNTTTELDAQPTSTTQDLIESPLTPTEHLNVTWPEEHIIESVDPSSLHYSPEVESGAHLSSHDLAPFESLTKGIVSDYHKIDHHWGEVVETGKTCIDFLGVERSLKPPISTSADFLGIERLTEPTMSTLALSLWLHLRFHEPHLAFHSSMCFTPEEHPSLVFRGPEENILFLKPFVDAWDRVGIG